MWGIIIDESRSSSKYNNGQVIKSHGKWNAFIFPVGQAQRRFLQTPRIATLRLPLALALAMGLVLSRAEPMPQLESGRLLTAAQQPQQQQQQQKVGWVCACVLQSKILSRNAPRFWAALRVTFIDVVRVVVVEADFAAGATPTLTMTSLSLSQPLLLTLS